MSNLPIPFAKSLSAKFQSLPKWQCWILIAVFVHALFVLFIGLDSSVIDKHSWRQSQTGITAYWLLQGGPWLAYETPVRGYPWSTPFEFPVYQLLVAGLARISTLSIDVCGRLVSFIFYIGVLPLIWRIGRHFQCNTQQLFFFSILYLISPFYLFWGRTVMIESTAVFFSLAWLTGLILYFANNNIRTFVIVLVVGSLGALAKISTFFVFAIAGGVYVLHWLYQQDKISFTSAFKPIIISLVMVLVPLALVLWYTDFADQLKQAHPFAKDMTSTSKGLIDWHYGALEKRIDISHWWEIFLRLFKNLIGPGSVLLLIIAFFFRWQKRELFIVSLLMLIFLSPILVFFNVHRYHGYYQYANYLFVLVVMAWILDKVFNRLTRRESLGILALVCIFSVGQFYYYYFPKMNRNDFLVVTDYIQQQTSSDQAIIVLGYASTPLIAYYSKRKSFNVPSDWVPGPADYLGGMPLGAVVVGGERKVNFQELNKFLSGFSNLRQRVFSTSIGKTVVVTGFQDKRIE